MRASPTSLLPTTHQYIDQTGRVNFVLCIKGLVYTQLGITRNQQVKLKTTKSSVLICFWHAIYK